MQLDMFKKIAGSTHYKKMQQSVLPLNVLGIKHLWYNSLSFNGDLEYIGTHEEWYEYCSLNKWKDICDSQSFKALINSKSGVQLFGLIPNKKIQTLMSFAKSNYNISFNIQIVQETENGVEAFGLGASSQNDSNVYENLLNELPVISRFLKDFRKKNAPIFEISKNNKFPLRDYLGADYFKPTLAKKLDRRHLLAELGYDFTLTSREEDLMKFLANGYPASYIAEELNLSKRTVEGYINNLKDKLDCYSKVDLIQKAKEYKSLYSNSFEL